MKSKIISFVVVLVFVMSMFPANVFADLNITCGTLDINVGGSFGGYTGNSSSGYYDSGGNQVSAATVCDSIGGIGGSCIYSSSQQGTTTSTSGNCTTTTTTTCDSRSSNTSCSSSSSSSSGSDSSEGDGSGSVILGLVLVGLIVWAWSKNDGFSSKNFEVTDDGTYAVAANNNNLSWKVSYGCEKEKEYSLGVSYSFK